MNKWLEMQVFAQVVEAGSFVGAARTLDMSRAAVSRYVSDLEARLGARLLQRTTRTLSVTDEGERFYQRCRDLLEGVAAAEAEITAHGGEAVGPLKVNAPVSFGILHLAGVWASFAALHPKVSVEVTLTDRLSDIVEEGFDLAVRISRLQNSSLVARPLATARMALCASPAYLARAGTPVHPRELANHAVLAYSHWAGGDEWEFQGPDGRVSVRTTPFLRANNGDTCRAGALLHQGVVLQPTFLVGEDLAQGRLVELCPGYRADGMGIYAMYGSRKHLPPRVRLLIDFLVAHFAQPRWPDGA